MSTITTPLAPSLAKLLAIAFPSPLAPPVTSAMPVVRPPERFVCGGLGMGWKEEAKGADGGGAFALKVGSDWAMLMAVRVVIGGVRWMTVSRRRSGC